MGGLADDYVRQIQWNLDYLNGFPNWSHFFHHLLAPFVSDIRQFASSANTDFEPDEPPLLLDSGSLYGSILTFEKDQCIESKWNCFAPSTNNVKGIHPNFTSVRYVPGFPSFLHLSIEGNLKKNALYMASKDELIVSVEQDPVDQEPDVEELSRRLCGRSLFVSWPQGCRPHSGF